MTRRAAVNGALMALGLLVAAACDAPVPEAAEETYEPLVAFDTIPAAVVSDGDTVRITAELANTADRRAYGLMERPELPEGHGMIFVYPETLTPTGQFWMYRTRVALDIAFLDEAGRIVAILAMDPCPSPNPDVCRRYSPGVPYRGALEVRQGFFDRHGMGVGDRVVPAPADLPAEH